MVENKFEHRYRPEINGLRAVAVIAVIINHFNKDILPSGYLGVDIFFVISGYVITLSLIKDRSDSFRSFISEFYKRRLKRLVPALLVCIVLSSILICFFTQSPKTYLRTGSLSLFGVSNIYLFKNSFDYFGQSLELNPFAHTWSLGVEEQFYFFFPICFWLTKPQREEDIKFRKLLYFLVSVSTISLIIFIHYYTSNQAFAYFMMPARFWEISLGSVIFLIYDKKSQLAQSFSNLNANFIFFLVISLFFTPIKYAIFSTIAICFLVCLLILSIKQKNIIYSLLTNNNSLIIGSMSYSLYLWHWPVISLSKWTIGIQAWTIPIQVAIIFLLAFLSYSIIENPIRQAKNFSNSLKIFQYTLLSLFFGTTLNYSLEKYLGGNLYILNNSFEGENVFWGKAWRDTNNQEIKNLAKCHISDNIDKNELNTCLKRNKNEKLFMIIGDSHAANYAVGIKNAYPNSSVKLYTVGWDCGYIPTRNASKISNLNCTDYVPFINDYIENNLMAGDIVFLSMKWSVKRKYKADLYPLIENLSKIIKAKESHLVLVDDVPELPEPQLCHKQWYRPKSKIAKNICNKSIEQVEREQRDYDVMGENLERNNSNIIYLKVKDVFCEENKSCGVLLKNKPVYFDPGHITSESSNLIINRLRERLSIITKQL